VDEEVEVDSGVIDAEDVCAEETVEVGDRVNELVADPVLVRLPVTDDVGVGEMVLVAVDEMVEVMLELLVEVDEIV
jgi:hypothetical protein